jgi:hypothetical protein
MEFTATHDDIVGAPVAPERQVAAPRHTGEVVALARAARPA